MSDVDVEVKNLHSISLRVSVSGLLALRLKLFMLLLRFACWVGSVGSIEFDDFEPNDKT